MKLKQKKADSGPSKTSKEMHALLQKKTERYWNFKTRENKWQENYCSKTN